MGEGETVGGVDKPGWGVCVEQGDGEESCDRAPDDEERGGGDVEPQERRMAGAESLASRKDDRVAVPRDNGADDSSERDDECWRGGPHSRHKADEGEVEGDGSDHGVTTRASVGRRQAEQAAGEVPAPLEDAIGENAERDKVDGGPPCVRQHAPGDEPGHRSREGEDHPHGGDAVGARAARTRLCGHPTSVPD